MVEWLALILLIPVILIPVVILFGFSGCDLVFKLEPPPDPVFERAFEAVLNNQTQRANGTIVLRIEPLRLFKSGTKVRFTLQHPANGDLLISALFISQAADTGDPYDAAADLTSVISAPVGLLGNPNGQVTELAPVDYQFDHTKPLLIALDIGSAGNMPHASNVPAAETRAFVGPRLTPPQHEAALADRQTGYAQEGRFFIVQRIDVA